ncbi:MAG: FAD/NAD(P)-binding protein, partial [Holophagales bacterium]|nr:FAD/NAD(P)-binding protein [Holophagales bacterium]
MNDLDWLIIGGGVHGVHLATRLVGEAGIEASRLRILDPGSRLLDRWRSFTAETGMSHLRSPGVHHLDLEPFSLIKLAGDRRSRGRGLLRGIYNRPSLELFNEHSDMVIERYGLNELHLRDEAQCLVPGARGVRVATRAGTEIVASRVVLAIGVGGQPEWPSWAPRDEPRIRHIFDGATDPPVTESQGERLVVLGGGISAAQLALRLAVGGRSVDLVSRHSIRVHEFDSDPGWLGPKLMPIFRREKCPEMRRRLITEARYRGSVTPEVKRALRAASASGRLEVHEDSVSGLQARNGCLRLSLASGRELEGDQLYLATGFARCRPGGQMLDRL